MGITHKLEANIMANKKKRKKKSLNLAATYSVRKTFMVYALYPCFHKWESNPGHELSMKWAHVVMNRPSEQ